MWAEIGLFNGSPVCSEVLTYGITTKSGGFAPRAVVK